MAEEVKGTEKPKGKISSEQICLDYRLNANFTKHIQRKYKDQKLTNSEWKAILKKERAI
jgi:hypothetical protein